VRLKPLGHLSGFKSDTAAAGIGMKALQKEDGSLSRTAFQFNIRLKSLSL
jgi:hypothetical protein